jgi:hypothetical protein
MEITLNLEQYNKIRRLGDFADWYLENMETSNRAYQADKEDIDWAHEVFQEIDAKLREKL